ncbi:MAG: hypothetical protein ACYDBQ_06310 [Thermoplasmatota archaeon]
MSLASTLSDHLGLTPEARLLMGSLYERQPATAGQLSHRTGLPAKAVERALRELSAHGILRRATGQRYVWLDLVHAVAPPLEGTA